MRTGRIYKFTNKINGKIYVGQTTQSFEERLKRHLQQIDDISRGVSWKEITHQFILPIRKNKRENQKLYNSIYGIV